MQGLLPVDGPDGRCVTRSAWALANGKTSYKFPYCLGIRGSRATVDTGGVPSCKLSVSRAERRDFLASGKNTETSLQTEAGAGGGVVEVRASNRSRERP